LYFQPGANCQSLCYVIRLRYSKVSCKDNQHVLFWTARQQIRTRVLHSFVAMLAPRSLRDSLGRWGNKTYSKPVHEHSKFSNGLNKSPEQTSLEIGAMIDCTISGPQEVPLGYNPSLKDDILHSEPLLLAPIKHNSSSGIQEESVIVSLNTPDDLFDINQFPDLLEDIPVAANAVASVENDLNSLAALERAHQTIQLEQLVQDIWACTVCWEHKDPSEFPARPPTASCYHPKTECCSSCLTSSITLSVKIRYWNDIRCPACDEHIDYEGMKEFAPEEVFEE
jgi:hypothetical protein